MKGAEYIKKYGLVCANIKVAEIEHTHIFDDFYFDLKRIIQSHELVEEHGGLDRLKDSFQMERDCGGVDMTPFGKKLYQAILDVESCQ